MLPILALIICAMTMFVLVLLVIVVVGIRREPPEEELAMQAPSLIAALVRRLLGVYVRKPGLLPIPSEQCSETRPSACASACRAEADYP
jgi:hypothetical protein